MNNSKQHDTPSMGCVVLGWRELAPHAPIGWTVQTSPSFFKSSKSHAYQLKLKFVCKRCKHEWVSPNAFVQYVIWDADKHVNIYAQIFCQECRMCSVFVAPTWTMQDILPSLHMMFEYWQQNEDMDDATAKKKKKKKAKKFMTGEADAGEHWSLAELNKTSTLFNPQKKLFSNWKLDSNNSSSIYSSAGYH